VAALVAVAGCVLVACGYPPLPQRGQQLDGGGDGPRLACGNNIVDDGEICDDGNTRDGDGCSRDCLSDETCGNGIIDSNIRLPEQCDDGQNNGKLNDPCSATCHRVMCGNGFVEQGEVCDDGNVNDTDGCNKTCTSTEVCGNGVVDHEVGEVCDPPSTGSCDANCHSSLECGNNIIDAGEQCDDGVNNNGDQAECRNDCVINRCGDGFVNSSSGPHHEECDDAPRVLVGDPTATPVETPNCNIDCTRSRCGDGKVNQHSQEQCDHGTLNGTPGDSCSATCHVQ